MKRLPVLLLLSLAACGGDDTPATNNDDGAICTLEASTWSPSVTGASSANHDTNTSISTTTLTATGPLTGLGQAAGSSQEISISIDMSTDLGANGSLSLVAETTNFPGGLQGGAYPILVYLSDGTNDLVNLTRSGSGGDCAQSGYFTCSGGSCSTNSSCTVQSPSAFASRTHWQQFQIPAFGNASSNTFPTCNWASGTPACAFNSTFFSGGKLRSGVTYTAKYVLLTDSYASVTGYTAGLRVNVIKKRDTSAVAGSNNGAVDLNVILVGSTNIAASRTTKGQTNLNELMNHVYTHFNQSGTGIKLGTVRAFDVATCDSGNAYANVDLDDLGTMLAQLSAEAPTSSAASALNVFIVSSIPYSGSGLTILGVAGAITGPMINGTGASGLAFSSFDELESFNPSCTGSSCPVASQEASFIDMGQTIAHEIGHYLGLNHPSESGGTTHDPIPDTPQCVAGGGGSVTHGSCLAGACLAGCGGYNGSSTFCATETDCQFNHIMWYTTKNYNTTTDTGDGNLFSTNSSAILNYNPYVQ